MRLFLTILQEYGPEVAARLWQLAADGGSNMQGMAKRDEMELVSVTHCAGHDFNLCVQAGDVGLVKEAFIRLRACAGHFRRSPSAQEQLEATNTELGIVTAKPQLDVPTR